MVSGLVTDSPPAVCSVSVTVQLAEPNWSTPGVKVRRPVALLTAGATAKKPAAARQLTVKASGSVSPGPAEMLVAQAALYAPESSLTGTTAVPGENDGGSFTAGKSARTSLSVDSHKQVFGVKRVK
jgi:hypothetical protein